MEFLTIQWALQPIFFWEKDPLDFQPMFIKRVGTTICEEGPLSISCTSHETRLLVFRRKKRFFNFNLNRSNEIESSGFIFVF